MFEILSWKSSARTGRHNNKSSYDLCNKILKFSIDILI